MVKEELTSEEKFFEKSVITERFIKKYKNIIVGAVVVVIVIIGANIAYNANESSRITAANDVFNELQMNPSNVGDLARLKALSPALHDAFLYSKAIADKNIDTLKKLKSSKSLLIGDLATYESAQNMKDASMLSSYTLKQDAIYKDLARVQNAIILMNDGKTDKAHELLKLISDTSSLNKVVQALLHYGVK